MKNTLFLIPCPIERARCFIHKWKGMLALILLLFQVLPGQSNGLVKETKISVSVKAVALKDVLAEIERQSDLHFFYSTNQINPKRKVSLQLTGTLEQVLNRLFDGKNISWEIDGKQILLRKIPEAVVTPVSHNQAAVQPTLNLPTLMAPSIMIVRDQEMSYQDILVRGRVTDESSGEPLPGVSILVKGTQQGTVTDSDGNFSINVINQSAVLVFSFVGYVTQELMVGNRSNFDIAMRVDEKALEEVVVVGFGERNRRDLTGSISTVNADAISRIGTASPQFALQGNTTGVRVINASGNPNEAPQIFIRGIGTWNGDSQPLYVVDGQILEPPRAGNEDVIGGGGLSTPPNLFNLINATDIESISVLKDASAAAVYGSRAANGVVLITTKRGKKGAPTLEFNTRIGIQNSPKYKLLNTTQFVDLAREMYTNSVNPDVSLERQLYGRDEPNDVIRMVSFNPQFDPQSPYYISDRTTYDWQDDMIVKNALNQSYDIKVSGANDRVDYYVSAGYFDQEGLIYGNNLTRMTGAINLNVKVTNWAKIGVNYKYTSQSSDLNVANLQDIADVAPWQPIYDPSNEYGFAPVINPYLFGDTWQAAKLYGQGSNPNYRAVTDLRYGGFDIDRNLGQFYLELKPIEGLTLRGSLNLDYTIQERISLDAWSRTSIFNPTSPDPRTRNPNAPNSLGSFGKRMNNIFNYQSDFTATYDNTFGKHNISLLAGVQDQRHEMENEDFSTQNLTNLEPNPKKNGFGGDLANNNSFYGWYQRYWFGMVGRGSYHYDHKYYLDLSYRRDASNGFARSYRWGNFYSISGAWRISSENFFNVPFIDDLKFRGGWGEAGNDQAAVGRYAYLSRVADGLSSYRWGSGNGNAIGNLQLGGLVADFPNPALSWEVATTTYVGFDAYLLKNKLNVTFEWYNRITSGILQTVNLPLSVGTNNPLFNIGEMANKGVDLQIGYNDKISDFNYSVTGNISFVRNKVTKLYQGQPLSIGGLFERDDAARVEEGRSVGVIWGYKVGGIFQTQEQIDQHFAQTPDNNVSNVAYVRPGDMYFQDVQGDPTPDEPFYSLTPDGKINSFDQTEIGNTIPGVSYGINLSFAWKGFDLSGSFYGEGDVEKYNAVRRRFEGMSGAGTNYFASTLNRWTPNNTNTDMPRAVVGDPAGNNRMSDRWVESAAFFRLNNWQLGYTLPKSVLGLVNNAVSSFRIYVGGENNIYAFKWRGIDPVNDGFPLPRTFSAGISVRF